MFIFTAEHKAQVENQLQARREEDLKNEHLFIMLDNVFHLVKVGNEAFVDASMLQGAEAYLHTHPVRSYEPLIPSKLDMQAMASSNKPQGVMNYSTHADVVNPTFWHSSIKATEQSLLGRLYRWGDYGSDGRGDCFAVIADWHRINTGYEFPIIPRDYYEKDAYYYSTLHQGICEIKRHDEPLEVGDILVVRVGRQGEHAGVYIGNGLMLHHPINGTSRHTPIHATMERLHMRLRVIME
jgi:cell wall-associated NlpC family hydrolase